MAPGATMNEIERAHQFYREGKYEEALDFYTEALSTAKIKPRKISLHSNRAACYLKLHDFKKAAEECTTVLALDHEHARALMLRAQTLVTLKEYHAALFYVNRLIELNPSSEVYRNLQARLNTQLESHLLQFQKMKGSLKKRMMKKDGAEVEENGKEGQDRKKMEQDKCQEKDTIDAEIANEPKTKCESKFTTAEPIIPLTFRNHLINKPRDGKQYQNQKDTLILTTRGGTESRMTPVKMKMMTMMRMSLSRNTSFVLKLLV
ncbi:TPR REGION domain-containing protein [Abeliophyllum distichum]|uniref:TPR REGION domain-containing protein n=1 Tax=Abeliophyllum distichum TaxID=126358 RepID=A0ABD1UFS7_9LAMI